MKLDGRKRKLDGVVVGGIGWEKFILHATKIVYCHRKVGLIMDEPSPVGYHLQNLRTLVDAAVVHDNHRIWKGPWVHLTKQAINKAGKATCVV